jgi:hypothetical protein
MSRMRDLVIDVQDAIEQGNLSYSQIASQFGISSNEVWAIARSIEEYYDSMANRFAAVDVGCEFDPKY